NRAYFDAIVDGAPNDHLVRVEIELVFRRTEAAGKAGRDAVAKHVADIGGSLIHESRRAEFAYHALLVDIPAAEVRRIVELDPGSLAGEDPIVAIVPQSVGTPIDTGDVAPLDLARSLPPNDDPIVAV